MAEKKEKPQLVLPSERATEINRERRKQYGSPADIYAVASFYWSAYLTQKNGREVTVHPTDIPMLQALHKIAREGSKHVDDNLDDVCGYMNVLYVLEEKGDFDV